MKKYSRFTSVICAVLCIVMCASLPVFADSELSELEKGSIFWDEDELEAVEGEAASDEAAGSETSDTDGKSLSELERESLFGDETEAADDTESTEEADTEEAESTGRVVFFLYHDIREGDTLAETDIQEWCTTEEKLTADILRLKELGYESLNCRRYYNGDYDKDKNYFVITFDDGYLSNYTILPDVLEATDAYADVFMCTAMSGLSNHFSYGQAKKMEETGRIKIYSHYDKHMYVDQLAPNVLRHGLKLSFGYLDDRLGDRDHFFAYPHSSYSLDTIQILYDFGVKLQFVQTWIPWYYGIEAEDYGMVLRVNVAFESDIEEAVSDYYRIMGWEYTPAEADGEDENAEDETADDTAAESEKGVNVGDTDAGEEGVGSEEGVNVGGEGEEADAEAEASEGVNVDDMNDSSEGVNIDGETEAVEGVNINA